MYRQEAMAFIIGSGRSRHDVTVEILPKFVLALSNSSMFSS